MKLSRRDGDDAGQIRRRRALAVIVVPPGEDRPVRLERQTVQPSRRDGLVACSRLDIGDYLAPPTNDCARTQSIGFRLASRAE